MSEIGQWAADNRMGIMDRDAKYAKWKLDGSYDHFWILAAVEHGASEGQKGRHDEPDCDVDAFDRKAALLHTPLEVLAGTLTKSDIHLVKRNFCVDSEPAPRCIRTNFFQKDSLNVTHHERWVRDGGANVVKDLPKILDPVCKHDFDKFLLGGEVIVERS